MHYLKKNQSKCRSILVEKTDRLYRNISDYSKVEDSGVTVHFVKRGSTLPPVRPNEFVPGRGLRYRESNHNHALSRAVHLDPSFILTPLVKNNSALE